MIDFAEVLDIPEEEPPLTRSLTQLELAHIERFFDLERRFLTFCDKLGHSRELSLAKTKMEEAAMWAIKGVEAWPEQT